TIEGGDREGIGVELNENEVIQKSANTGVKKEMMNIGHSYQNSIEVRRKEEGEWYMKRVKGGNVGGNFDPGGSYCQIGIMAGKVNAYWCGIMGNSSNFRRKEFRPKQVLIFNAATSQVVKKSVKMELNQSKEKIELKELAKNLKNLTKEVTLYLPLWSKPLIFDSGGMFVGRSKELNFQLFSFITVGVVPIEFVLSSKALQFFSVPLIKQSLQYLHWLPNLTKKHLK
ncbi:10781_t:CDS:2, partial [Gigaspora rosea]